jgi:hypothetical protein
MSVAVIDAAAIEILCAHAAAYLRAADLRAEKLDCALCNTGTTGWAVVPGSAARWVNHLCSARHRYRERVAALVAAGYVCMKPGWKRVHVRSGARRVVLHDGQAVRGFAQFETWQRVALRPGDGPYPYETRRPRIEILTQLASPPKPFLDFPLRWILPGEALVVEAAAPTRVDKRTKRALPRDTCVDSELTERMKAFGRAVPAAWSNFLVGQLDEMGAWRAKFDAVFSTQWGARKVQSPLGHAFKELPF